MSIEALKEQARGHEQNDEWEKALSLYVRAINQLSEDDQPDLGLYNRAGDISTRLGNLEGAIGYYEQAVDLYLDSELPNNAIAICKKILRNVPGRAEVFLKMGQIRARQGFLTDARENFLTYAEKNLEQGEMEEAFRALSEFADLAPDDLEIQFALAQQLAAHDQVEEAVFQLVRAYHRQVAAGRLEAADLVEERIRAIDPDAEIPPAPSVDDDLGGFESTSLADAYEQGDTEDRGSEGPGGSDAIAVAPEAGDAASHADDFDDEDSGFADFTPPPSDQGLVLEQTAAFASEPADASEADEAEWEEDAVTGTVIESDELESGDEALLDDDQALIGSSVGFEEPRVRAPEPEDFRPDATPAFADLDETEDAEWGNESVEEGPEFALPALDDADEDAVTPLPLLDDFSEMGTVPEPEADLGVPDFELAAEAPEARALALAKTGRASVEAGERHDALASFEEAHEAFAEAGDIRAALGIVSELIALEPDEAAYHQRAVEYAHRSDDHPLLIGAYLDLAECLGRTGSADKAGAVYEQVLILDPGNRRALAGLDTGDSDVGNAYLEAAKDDYVDLGSLVIEQGRKTTRWNVEAGDPSGDEDADFQKMLSTFKAKVAENVDVGDVKAHYDLGTAYKEMGLLDEAIAEFQHALRADSHNLATYEMLGQCFMDKGQYEVALRSLTRATELPWEVEDELLGIYYYLGRVQEHLGNSDGAVESYERVFALDINFRDVTDRLRALR